MKFTKYFLYDIIKKAVNTDYSKKERMMYMLKKLQAEIKEAMINKDVIKRDVLKMVLNKAREIAKEAKTEDVSDEMIVDAAKKELKQIQQTIDSLAGKEESTLYQESLKKADILKEGYIPKQLTEDELRVELTRFIEENGLKGQGRAAMKTVMPAFKNKADGKLISKLIGELA